MRESSFSDGCHAVGDGDGGRQAAAIRESITADGGHAVGDGDGCQAAAFLESKIADGCHAVGDGDGGQADATIESVIADGCHVIGLSLIYDRRWDNYVVSIFIGIIISRRALITYRQLCIIFYPIIINGDTI